MRDVNGSITVSKTVCEGSNPSVPEQECKELRRLPPELGTRTKLEIMDSVVILEHLKVEEFAMESADLMFSPSRRGLSLIGQLRKTRSAKSMLLHIKTTIHLKRVMNFRESLN